MCTKRNQEGFIPLAVLGVVFLTLSLVGVTVVASNPDVKQLIDSQARIIRDVIPERISDNPEALKERRDKAIRESRREDREPNASAPEPSGSTTPPSTGTEIANRPCTSNGGCTLEQIKLLQSTTGQLGFVLPNEEVTGFYRTNDKYFPTAQESGGPTNDQLKELVDKVNEQNKQLESKPTDETQEENLEPPAQPPIQPPPPAETASGVQENTGITTGGVTSTLDKNTRTQTEIPPVAFIDIYGEPVTKDDEQTALLELQMKSYAQRRELANTTLTSIQVAYELDPSRRDGSLIRIETMIDRNLSNGAIVDTETKRSSVRNIDGNTPKPGTITNDFIYETRYEGEKDNGSRKDIIVKRDSKGNVLDLWIEAFTYDSKSGWKEDPITSWRLNTLSPPDPKQFGQGPTIPNTIPIVGNTPTLPGSIPLNQNSQQTLQMLLGSTTDTYQTTGENLTPEEINEKMKQLAANLGGLGAYKYDYGANFCGPLSAEILKNVGLFEGNINDMYQLNPDIDMWRLDKHFPQSEFERIDNMGKRISIGDYDWSANPLKPGDFVYLDARRGYDSFEHMLVVSKIDKDGKAYSVTNYTTDGGKTHLVSEVLLYNPNNPNDPEAYFNRWTDRNLKTIYGNTGQNGFLIERPLPQTIEEAVSGTQTGQVPAQESTSPQELVQNAPVNTSDFVNFPVFMQNQNDNGVEINDFGGTMKRWGCGPSTAYNILRLTGKDVTMTQVLDKYLWTSSGSSADGVLYSLRQNGFPPDTISYGTKNRITDAEDLVGKEGTFVYFGKTNSVEHIAAFECKNSTCYAIDSFFGKGKPEACSVQGSNRVKCGEASYYVGETGGSPAAFYPVKEL